MSLSQHSDLPSYDANRQRILVVDDDPLILSALRGVLEDEGFAVVTAADGREAVERASNRRPALVVLDITLPVLDGFAVATALRAAHGPGLPILAMTADGAAEEKAARAGAYAYLRKPFELDDVVRAVKSGLHRVQ